MNQPAHRPRRASRHPYVSEAHEGKPAFEWAVAGAVAVCAILAVTGQMIWAVSLLSLTSIVTATLRLVLKTKSPWKIRSVGFDCFFGFSFGIGLMIAYMVLIMF
ncbi:DUF3017 domain-containing protein [Bifidobacterium simiarum]|uniref:DUF3017 domain-containing protein n=1 Tax=Bifidobacterium simiarum TaxID=2045441 RepID=A0A2M9HD98_9BIFI|nr:DUF3017 domain-containing protein [Bifidobacterium simiarum]PJM74782.1 DUF3017 domain-containing protein [Bifidobacterium simiarum]